MLKGIISHYKSSFKGLPRNVWLLSVVVLINRSGSMVLFFMTLYLTKELNFSVTEAGQMISVYGLGAMGGAVLGGWLTDKIGTAKVQALSLFISGIGFILLNYFETAIEIALFLFFIAAVHESFRPANASALAIAAPPEKRARAFALNRLAINLGVTIGPAVGGLLATINYDFLFWADGVTCIAASIFVLYFFNNKMEFRKTTNRVNVKIGISPFKDIPYLFMLFLLLIMGSVFVQIFNAYPLYLKSITKFNEDSIGLLIALNALLVVLIEMPIVHKVEGSGQLKLMALGSLLFFGGFAIMPFSNAYLYIAATVIIWSLGEILVFPFASSFVANRADENNRGKYMGLFTFSFALSFIIGPTAGTYIYEKFGPENLWYACGVLGVFVAGGFLLLNNYLNKRN
ncbi:MAG: MFS transporter [Ignavibacteriae bacterium]|nr:MFS transporter [Ignavibacteriota bacterium]NOG98551.1 MFS transporter [Ignavibacteriota bacterium]